MTGLSLTVCLALAWFLAVNATLSIAIAGVAAWRQRRALRKRAGATPLPGSTSLGMRLFPCVATVAFVAGVFVPAFLVHEPANGPEAVGWVVRGAALAALAIGVSAARRGLTARRRARAIVDRWMAGAAPFQLDDACSTAVRAYAIEDPFPVVALVGVRRPRLFVARQVLEALTPGELRAAVAHELAHWRAWDNAKRLLLSWSPDLIGWSAIGRRLEGQWAAAAECAADRRAADSPARALDMAGALVKVSRLAVTPAPGLLLFSTLHEQGGVTDRVARLLAGPPAAVRRPFRRRATLAAIAAGCAVASLPGVLMTVHAVTEACLRLLP